MAEGSSDHLGRVGSGHTYVRKMYYVYHIRYALSQPKKLVCGHGRRRRPRNDHDLSLYSTLYCTYKLYYAGRFT